MKEFAGRVFGFWLDARVVVGVIGVILSVVMHEVFHVFMHLGEIRGINLFPDKASIVEIVFMPTAEYDLAFEEALAYTITMITLILTAMLVSEIHDSRDERTVGEVMGADVADLDPAALSALLGVNQAQAD